MVLLPAGRFESRTIGPWSSIHLFFYNIACHVTENHDRSIEKSMTDLCQSANFENFKSVESRSSTPGSCPCRKPAAGGANGLRKR